MYKVFGWLLFSLMVLTVSAQVKQDTVQHLVFKGVPLDGTLNEYVAKMKKTGFAHISTQDGTAILNGDFAGYKHCQVGVSTLKQKDLVYRIVVMFPEMETWGALSGNYYNLKKLLTEKYGDPAMVVETFDGYSQPDEDDDKMYKVKFDNCKYYAIWETDKGDIQ